MRKSDYIVILLFAIIAFFLFRECNLTIPEDIKTDSIKTEIKKHFVKKDSIKAENKKNDYVRVVYLTKWKKAKEIVLTDTVYKHDTIIKQLVAACDSVLVKDSVLISGLKSEITQDSLIIAGYKKVVKNDSVTIRKLKKGRLKYFFAGLASGFGLRAVIPN